MFRSLTVSTIATLGLAAAASPARADLLAYYTFEGNAHNVAPGHTGSYDGTPINDPALSPGFAGQAYHFDGVNDFISVPLDINPASLPTLTMGAWVKSESRTGIQQIISHDNGGYDRSLGLDYRGSSPFAYNFATFAGSASVLNANLYSTDWTFLAAVYDAPHSSVKLYVNGSLAASATATHGTGLTSLRIGSNPAFIEFFAGAIDNVFFYDEALDANSISALYANGGPLLPSHHNPGDTNNDGTVDLTDLNNVLNNFGSPGTIGDDDSSGTVDLTDLNNVLNNFGTTYSSVSAVPEPASTFACLFAAHPLLARRRRP
jgi:hypothetical protein